MYQVSLPENKNKQTREKTPHVFLVIKVVPSFIKIYIRMCVFLLPSLLTHCIIFLGQVFYETDM